MQSHVKSFVLACAAAVHLGQLQFSDISMHSAFRIFYCREALSVYALIFFYGTLKGYRIE